MSGSVATIVSKTGAFMRPSSYFRSSISTDGSTPFPPEANRYHLFVSLACPWASRCLAALHLKGLSSIIGVSIVHPTFQPTRPTIDQHMGWCFKSAGDPPLTNADGYGSIKCDATLTGCPDPVTGASFIRDIYETALQTIGQPKDLTITYSVPILLCKHTNSIVNNESSDIMRILNSSFNSYALNPTTDLYPNELKSKIDEVNEWVYIHINNGVYKCGFAKSQAAYDAAVEMLFVHLDKCEEILKRQRYLIGEQLTEADVRLFMTLIRFDEVYTSYFKTNCKCIHQYDALMEYCRELYQMEGIRASVNMEHIKNHYFTSHKWLNPFAIIPKGPNFLKMLEVPHKRGEM
uniref:Omega-class glutathione transferase n=1 Tax=Nephromyces sp. MMRI TaxID=2496275 RepID=A0A3Q8UC17_9APIC|nr:omega-class glutathione transferase [Nephromyces sp. MMRI]